MAVAAGSAAVACLLVVLGLAAVAGVDGATASSHPAPAPAPAPAVDSTAAEARKGGASLDYVTPGNPPRSQPSKACCGEVKGVLKDIAGVGCLCAAISTHALPLPINATRVLHLPAACGADASAFTMCLGQSTYFDLLLL
jgi:hypothetical protein